MSRRASVLLLIAVIAAFALGWRAGLFEPRSAPDRTALVPEASLPAGGEASSGGQGASTTSSEAITPLPGGSPGEAQTPGKAPGTGNDDAAAVADPSFDVVRVEPDGSAVIAGRGRPNQTIALVNGNATVAEGKTDANGDFVMSLTLPQGAHRLRLAQGAIKGSSGLSSDAAVVNVPAKGRGNELMVMMERPGQPSDIIVRPRPDPQVVAARTPDQPEAQTDGAASAVPAPVSQAAATPSGSTQPTDAPAGSLAVEAVEIEGGKLFIAGSATDRSSVRIYLDGRFVAETQGGAGERFIASAMADVPVGDHIIRADEIDAAGRVVARAEVPFRRPDNSAMSAVAGMVNPGRSASNASGEASASRVQPGGVAVSEAGIATSPSASTGESASSAAGSTGVPDGLRTVTQAPLETVAAARVIIRRGDTLWRISRDTYGKGSRYTVIYLANGDQIRNPDRIYPGQVFRMPKDEPEPPRG